MLKSLLIETKEETWPRRASGPDGSRFAGLLMIVIGSIDFFQGLIAIIRDKYYVLTPNQILVFDMTTWGWVMLIWGIVVALAGLGLLSGPVSRAGSRSSSRA